MHVRLATHPEMSRCTFAIQLRAETNMRALFTCVDNTVRAYVMSDGQLQPHRTLPHFAGSPLHLVLDAHRPAVFLRDANQNELFVSVCGAGGEWTAWRTLARDTQEKLYIRSLCMVGPHTLAIFDYYSRSVKLYDLA